MRRRGSFEGAEAPRWGRADSRASASDAPIGAGDRARRAGSLRPAAHANVLDVRSFVASGTRT
jgi:hypothetical protein